MGAKNAPDVANDRWPNLFIVGAAKAGTSSLHECLSQHSDVYMSPVKEPHFFSEVRSHHVDEYMRPRNGRSYHSRIVRDVSDYLALFAASRDEVVCGESSPSYLWDCQAAVRIREAVPDARIIVILRDPVERAYSHYLMDVVTGLQRQTFRDAVQKDLNSPKKGWGLSHLYVELGLYSEQVRRYIEVFGPQSVLILEFEEFCSDPRTVLDRVLRFLDVPNRHDHDAINLETKHNAYSPPKNGIAKLVTSHRTLRQAIRWLIPAENVRAKLKKPFFVLEGAVKPPMDPSAVDFLWSLYDADISRLEEIVGRSLPSLRRTHTR